MKNVVLPTQKQSSLAAAPVTGITSEFNLSRSKLSVVETLRLLHQITQALSTTLHLPEVDVVCRAILQIPGLKEIFQFDGAEICLLNTHTGVLTTALYWPDDQNNFQQSKQIYHPNEGYTGWIAVHQKSLMIADTHHFIEATPQAGLLNFPYHSYLGVPLKVGAKLLGTLELAAAPIGAYNQDDLSILETIAAHAAVAIDYARLYQDTQRTLVRQSFLFDASREFSSTLSYEELLSEVCWRMIDTFDADACTISAFDEVGGTLTLLQQHVNTDPPSTIPPTGRQNGGKHPPADALAITVSRLPALQSALRSQTCLVIRADTPVDHPNEVEWLKQHHYGVMVIIPMISRDKVTGLLQLFAASSQAFSENDIWLAQALVSQVNIALENAKLFSLTDQQLQQRVDELAGLQRVSAELNSTLDLNRLLHLALEEAMRVTQADFGSVNLYDAQLGHLVAHTEQVSFERLHPAAQTLTPNALTLATMPALLTQALRTGKAVLVGDVRANDSGPNLGGALTRAKAVVPIFYGGEPAGLINLESARADFFNQEQLRYLEALANQAGVAIGNTQAYQEQKRERERANRRADQLARLSEISNAFRTNRPLSEVLEDIAYAIVESVGFNVVLMSLVEGNPPVISHQVGAGIPVAQVEALKNPSRPRPLADLQAVMQPEFRLRNSYFIPAERQAVWQDRLDVPRIEKVRPVQSHTEWPSASTQAERVWQSGDVLFVPFTDTNKQIIGLLTVEDPDSGERPDALSLQTLEIFANQAAAAIENARLFAREKQRRRLADTLRNLAEVVSSKLDFDELLNIVLQELAKVVEYDHATLQLLQEDKLVVVGGRGRPGSQQLVGLSFSMDGRNPSRRVMETQEPLIIHDVQVDYIEAFADVPVHSWLGVPLTYGTNVLGVMTVDTHQLNFFTQEDAGVVLAFANQVAVALQNAHLFEEARQQVRQLAALSEVGQSLNRALNVNQVLNLVLDAVFDLVSERRGSIWLIDQANRTVKVANTKNVSALLVELFNKNAVSVDSEPFAQVIASGQVMVVHGDSNREAVIPIGLPFPSDVTYVPLKTEEGVSGILAIETVIHNKNTLKLVTTLADLAAVAIDRARLLEDTRQRASEMQSLYRLGVEVTGTFDVRRVMFAVVSHALTLTDTQLGAILYWDEDHKQYLLEGVLNTDNPIAPAILDDAKKSLEYDPSERKAGSLWSNLTQSIMQTGQPILLSASGLGNSLGSNGQTGQPKVLLPYGVQAMLGAPIQMQNQAHGAIFVGSLTPRNFGEREVQLLSFVANQAAVAIRNAQLVQRLNLFTEELERRVALRTEELAHTLQDLTEERDRFEALYQITRELSTSLDLDRILSEALSLINRAIGISQGAILLLDHETGRLIFRSALGRARALARSGELTAYRPGYGLAGKVIETRQPRIVPDLAYDPDWITTKDTPERRSALAVPLITGEDALGALLLFHPDPDYFSEDHLKMVTAAATQIATAINNAELYRLITDQAQRLGVMFRTQAAETSKNQAILRGITDGVLVLDPDRNIVLVNPKAAEILNLDAAKLENQPIAWSLGQSRLQEESELIRLFYHNLLKALEAIEAGERAAEFRFVTGKKAVTVALAPVTITGEELPSIVAVLRDISREVEIDRLKNEFISTVSHELRTPMTSIKGYADLLVSGSSQVGELNPTQRRFVQVIQSNANRLHGLVNDILEISRIETGRVKLELASLDLSKIIEEVAVSFEGQMVKKFLHLSLNLPQNLPPVYADQARVTQILVNLVGNAWQYTPEGGHIIIHASVVDDQFVQVDVEDTGIGIVEEDIAYVFDRFFRSERTEVQVVDGTGLGLSITRMYTEMLGGKIWVKSQLDMGTTFSFTLPLAAPEAG